MNTTARTTQATRDTPRRTLTGDRNQCPTCGEYFNSTLAFDTHRVGRHVGNQRTCLTVPQMRAGSMALNAAGFWVSRAWVPHPIRNAEVIAA